METFVEYETMCREPPPGHSVRGKFGGNRSKESGRGGASLTSQKKQRL